MASLARGGETGKRIRDHDWASTAIGSFEAWPAELRAAVGIMVRSDLAMAMLWGESNVLLYNDAYSRHFEAHQAGSLGGAGDEQPHFPASILRRVHAGEAVYLQNEKTPVHRQGRAEDAWFDFDYSPLFGENGKAEGVLAVIVETTDRVTTAESLGECEERVRSLVGTVNVGLAQIDRDERITYLNQRFCDILGRDRQSVLGLRQQDLIHPEDRPLAGERLARLFQRGETFVTEQRLLRQDGEGVWVNCSVSPVRDRSGEIVGAMAAAIDISRRVEIEQNLRASESRLRTLIEGIPQLVWRSSGEGSWQWSSPQWQRATGQSLRESLDFGWLEAVHPADRQLLRRAWAEAGGSGGLDVECRIYIAAKKAYRWFQTRAAPALGEGGRVVEWLGTSTDIDELRLLHRDQKVLFEELQHRVRNTLSVVRAICRKTAEALPESHPYAMHLDGRLEAFARAQAAVTREPGRGLDLETIVLDEIQALNADTRQIEIGGPALRLKPKAGQLVSLAIHEIATNALKFGAFAAPEGRAEVDWALDDRSGGLRFTWSETGFIPTDPGKREGFGFELLKRTLPYEIDAKTDIRLGSNGIVIRLDLPPAEIVTAED